MKILHVIEQFKPAWDAGGMTRVCYEISKRQVSHGHEVTVYTTDGFTFRLDVERNKPVDVDGVTVYYFRNISTNIIKVLGITTPYYFPFVAKKQIKHFDVIHIHAHRTPMAAVTYHYAKKFGIPYVLQAHGSVLPFFEKQRIKKLYDFIIGYKIIKDAFRLLALNKMGLNQYKRMGADEHKIEIIPNGIDLSKYDQIPKKGEFRSKHSINDDEKIILYLGRIHRIKGIDLLVDAFADVINEVDNAKLVVVGPDDGFLSMLKKQIANLKIDDKILFTGPLYERDKLEAYVDADVYVLPSVYEIFGITALESCACGTPVIVTDNCGIANLVDGKVGCVVEFDKSQLRDAMFKILSDEKSRRKFGENGRKLVEERFDWGKIIDRVEKIYSAVKNGQR